MTKHRRNHYDVTNTVRISHPSDVCAAVCSIFKTRYPGTDLTPVRRAFDTFTDLYTGDLPGYLGNDTWYHDAQHSLDCTLAMARVVDGYDKTAPAKWRLGERRAVLGVIAALFHDAGYIRRSSDPERHGAEFTLIHVRRSGEFLAEFLPRFGFNDATEMVKQLVHFTGYEIALDKVQVRDPLDRQLGFLLGSADLLAQLSDRCYLEKCRDFLFPEFEICGLAGAPHADGPKPIYASPDDLLRKTPDFNRKIFYDRLDGYFDGAHRHMKDHFGGRNPYLEVIEAHLQRLKQLLKKNRLNALRLRPEPINGPRLRKLLGRRGKVLHFPTPEKASGVQHAAHRVTVKEQRRFVPA